MMKRIWVTALFALVVVGAHGCADDPADQGGTRSNNLGDLRSGHPDAAPSGNDATGDTDNADTGVEPDLGSNDTGLDSGADTAGTLDTDDSGAGKDASDASDAAEAGVCNACSGCMDECRDSGCASAIADTWNGDYVCAQGLTNLELEVSGASDDLIAIFRFSEHHTNPGVPSGSYSLTGSLDCSGNLVLEPEAWIDDPGNYKMVGLEGMLSTDGKTLSGEVASTDCETFEVTRQ